MSESGKYPLVPLSEVLVQDKEYVTELEPRLYPKLSVKLYGKGVVLTDPADGATVRMKRHQLAKPGQVILSEIWAKKGAIGIVPEEGASALVTSHFFLFEIDESKLLRPYMRWLLVANYFEPALGEQARGTTGYAAIRPKQFLACKIPLPPLDEQRRIVARIEELAALIEEVRGLRFKAREEAEALLASALNEVFSQFSTENVERWSLSNLELCRLVPGQHIMSRDYNPDGEGTPYITGPADFGTRFPEISKWTISPKSFSEPGDVLVTVKGAGVGKINCAPGFPLCIGRQVMALRPNSKHLVRDYLYYFLMDNYGYFQGVARSTTVPGLKREHIWDMDIPLPPVVDQRRIVAYLDSLQAQVDELTALQDTTQSELDALLPSVLDRAFRGEL
jgi:type I restriction enzyme S subunit